MLKEKEPIKSEIFTLWADDSQAVAVNTSDRFVNELKAHLVLNYIFNDTIVLSDSQAITCRNFRHLIRRGDSVIEDLVKSGGISVAMRNKEDGKGVCDLLTLEQEFRVKKIIREANCMVDSKVKDLEFLQEHAEKKEWLFSEISKNYEVNSKRLLKSHFYEKLKDRDIDKFQETISEYEEHSQINRMFLQEVLLKETLPKLSGSYDESLLRKTLEETYTAPYVSNLPTVLDLNPIYLAEHKKSFQVFRGEIYDWINIDEPEVITPRLDGSHFVEGMCRFVSQDIKDLKDSDEVSEFRSLMRVKIKDNDSNHKRLKQSFIYCNKLIEQRMFERFPELFTSTTVAQDITYRRQLAVVKENINSKHLDLLALTLTISGPLWAVSPVLGATAASAGTGLSAFSLIRDVLADEDSISKNSKLMAIGKHEFHLNEIRDDLIGKGKGYKTPISIQMKNTKGFKQETISSY